MLYFPEVKYIKENIKYFSNFKRKVIKYALLIKKFNTQKTPR